jgi:dCMP deaminase
MDNMSEMLQYTLKQLECDELYIPSWDELFLRMVYLISTKSLDPRTKIGAVLVKDKRVISMGYNGFPGGVNDLSERYNNREDKYKYIVHSEDNCVLTAARFGISTRGTTLYTNGVPCCECSKSIIQGGIKEIVIHKQWPDMTHSGWIESTRISKIMFDEAGVNIRVVDKKLKIKSMLDGKIINV